MSSPDPDYIVRATKPDGAPAQPYDFARPRSFSDRHLGAAEAAHAALADGLANELTAALREPVTARCSPLDEVLAVDFERSRSRPAALFGARLGDGGPVLGVDLAPAFALFLVERHLGATDPLGTSVRALSDLERAVIERHWFPLLGVAFAEAWATVPPRPDRFASDPEALALAPPDARVVVADLEVTIGEASTVLSICYPTETLRTLLGAPQAPPAEVAPLDGLPLDLRAELGRTRLPVGDLLRLAPGDVIPLPQAVDAPVPVWVGDRFRFEARTGIRGKRLALQVLTPPAPPTKS